MSDWRSIDDGAPLYELVRIKLDNDHETVGERVGQNLWMFDTTADWDDFTSEMVGWKPLPEGPPQPPAPLPITIFDGPDDLPWPPLAQAGVTEGRDALAARGAEGE